MNNQGRTAIILAGGFGTRLAHIVNNAPKPMAPVAGRPFLRFILDNLSENRFTHVVIADGHLRAVIESYFGESYRGMEIVYSPEDEPLFTGGAVKRALNLCEDEWVFILNGDTYLDVGFDELEKVAHKYGADRIGFLAIKEMHDFDRYGTVTIRTSDMAIQSFNEKKHCAAGMINAGVYLLKSNSLRNMPDKFSLETNFFEKIVSDNLLGYVPMSGTFIDIGIPEDYELAQSLLAPLAKNWKLAIFDRDGTLNVDTGHLFEPSKLEFIPTGLDLLRQFSANPEYKVVVATNQAGIAKGLYTVDQMQEFHRYFEHELESLGGRVDAFYFCPHHPDYTGPCDCRKPKPGMINKAVFDFEADPARCIMIGDNDSDMIAAQSAGIGQYIDIGKLIW